MQPDPNQSEAKGRPSPQKNAGNRRVAYGLAGIVVAMIGMSYAAVPLYDLFCRTTGYGGTTQRADAAADQVLDREIIVRFDANVSGLPWRFRPAQPQLALKVGETGLAIFVAQNNAAYATAGTATFNVTPSAAGAYFNKIECFCFTRQDLNPGETVEMAVQFFIDPAIVDDQDLDATRTITLSYSYFPVDDAERKVTQTGHPVAQTMADEPSKKL